MRILPAEGLEDSVVLMPPTSPQLKLLILASGFRLFKGRLRAPLPRG